MLIWPSLDPQDSQGKEGLNWMLSLLMLTSCHPTAALVTISAWPRTNTKTESMAVGDIHSQCRFKPLPPDLPRCHWKVGLLQWVTINWVSRAEEPSNFTSWGFASTKPNCKVATTGKQALTCWHQHCSGEDFPSLYLQLFSLFCSQVSLYFNIKHFTSPSLLFSLARSLWEITRLWGLVFLLFWLIINLAKAMWNF